MANLAERLGRKIVMLGSLASMQLPAGIEHIDLPGETLLPGLIDMHVHLDSLAEIGGYQGLKYTDSFWEAVGVANARKTIDAGFTTVRNVGSADFNDVGLKEARNAGGTVHLVNLTREVMRLLQITGLERVFEIGAPYPANN